MALLPETDTSEKDHSKLLQDAGMYVFMDEVTDETIKPIIEWILVENHVTCLLYTSPSPRDRQKSRMPSSA